MNKLKYVLQCPPFSLEKWYVSFEPKSVRRPSVRTHEWTLDGYFKCPKPNLHIKGANLLKMTFIP